jgi:tetraacyldisaccharide 4'-kinase
MRLVVTGVRLFLTGLGKTWRLQWQGREHLESARRDSPGGNVIFAFWHNSLAILAHTHRHRDVHVLVSQHRDGELIAQVVAGMGFGLVRGSSRRGGLQALFGLAREIERGRDVAITVDGPIGPRYSVQPGIILLARRTGRPVVPVLVSAKPCSELPTWDALRLPHPGARLRLRYGEPLWVGPSEAGSATSAMRERLEKNMQHWTREDELSWGRRVDLRDVQDRRPWAERRSERPHPGVLLRGLAHLHGLARRLETGLRPRPVGRGERPWVVGVGNLEAGGTGKTPCLVELTRALQQQSCHVAILTRGHGGQLGRRKPSLFRGDPGPEASDETRFLAQALGASVPLVVSRDKRRGLELLRHRGDVDVVLVDDALQTARLPVDRHLVLLDWEAPLGNGWLLPAGRLRESPRGLQRAHALLFTRARGGIPRHPAWAHLPPEACFLAREEFPGLSRRDGTLLAADELRGQGVALLCGLGRPRAFEAAMETLGAQAGFAVRRRVRVGDHADLVPALRKLLEQVPRLDCSFVVLTRKDGMRLPEAWKDKEPLLVLEQRLHVDSLGELIPILVPAVAQSSSKLAKLTEREA